MGQTGSKDTHDEAIENELAKLLKETEFEQEEIMILFEEFRDVSKNMVSLDKKQFTQVLDGIGLLERISELAIQDLEPPLHAKKTVGISSQLAPDSSPSESSYTLHLSETAVTKDVVNALFRMFDENGDNKLDFKEFIYGISVLLRGTLEQKAAMVFRVYDLNHDGNISRSDLFNAIKNSMKAAKKIKQGSMKQFKEDMGKTKAQDLAKKLEELSKDRSITSIVEEIFSEADSKETGSITPEEFINFVKKHPEALYPLPQISFNFALHTSKEGRIASTSSSSSSPSTAAS